MVTLFNEITRATSGPTTDPTRAAAIFAVLGTSSTQPAGGAGPVMFANDGQPEDDFGYGPMPEAAAMISQYSGAATIGMRLDEAAPGANGAIDDDDFTGTVVATADTDLEPYNNHELYVEFITGTTGLGTAGATYKKSYDGGRTFRPGETRIALGSDVSIPFARANAAILLGMPSAQVSALVTLAAEIRTKTLAHFAEGSTVHLTADVTSGTGIGGAPTDETTSIARLNECRTALIAHATNNTVHTADDTTSFVDLPAAADTGPEAVALAIAIKDALNLHLDITGSVHGSNPATALVSSADPTTGTIVAGDILRLSVTAPAWDATGLGAVLTDADTEPAGALTAYTRAYGGIVIVGRFPVAAWTTLINGLDALRARQRPVIALIEARLPNDGETAAQYRAALELEWSGLYDERVHVVSGDGRFDPTRISKALYQSRRLHTAPLAARLAALDYAESPGVIRESTRTRGIPSKFGGPLDGYAIRDSVGALFGVDAFLDNSAMTAAGFGAVTSVPNTDASRCYVSNPVMRAEAGNTASHIAHQRLAVVVETILYVEGTKFIQEHPPREPGRTTIRPDAADRMDGFMNEAVFAVVGDPNKSASPRLTSFAFRVDRSADISTDPVSLPWTAEMVTGAYIVKLSGVFSINGGA